MRDYGDEMQEGFEREWAAYLRRERRRVKIRGALRLTVKIIAFALGVAVIAALGAIAGICALFPDCACERIFKS